MKTLLKVLFALIFVGMLVQCVNDNDEAYCDDYDRNRFGECQPIETMTDAEVEEELEYYIEKSME